jgi:hypothetical protein
MIRTALFDGGQPKPPLFQGSFVGHGNGFAGASCERVGRRGFCHEVQIDSIRPCRRLAARGLVGEPDVCRPEIVVRRAASQTNDENEGASSGPRSRTRRFPPADFSFAFVGRGEPLLLLLRFKAMLFGRAGKSGRPPPLEPSLEVQRDIAHNQISGFAVAPGSKVSTRAGL